MSLLEDLILLNIASVVMSAFIINSYLKENNALDVLAFKTLKDSFKELSDEVGETTTLINTNIKAINKSLSDVASNERFIKNALHDLVILRNTRRDTDS